jgi:cyanate permease
VASPANAPAPASAYRWLIEVLLFLSYFLFGMSWIGYSPFLKEFQARYALNHSEAGLLISSVSFAKIFVPFVAGWLGARLGVKRALLAGMVCICASAWSPFAGDYASLLVSRFVLGAGGAVVVTLFGAAVLQWFPPKERPLLNGVNGVAVNAGITLALYITVPLAARSSQTDVLAAYAAASLLITLLWALLGRDRAAPAQPAAAGAAPARESYAEVLRRRETWLLAVGFAGPLAVYLTFNTWLPTFYEQAFGMSRATGSQLTGLANLVGIPAAIIGGYLTKRFARRKPFIWGSGIVTSIAAFGMFLSPDRTLLVVSAVVFGAALFLWVSPLVTLAMELPGMTPARFSMVMGVFFGVSYILAFAAPILTGALRDRFGTFIPGFAVFAASCWTLAVAGWLLPETGKSAK